MSDISLPDRLRSWAQNEEMVDSGYTEHGHDCNEAARHIERMEEELGVLREREEKLKNRKPFTAHEVRQFHNAPCFICGYEHGPYYYSPRVHACAARYHAAAYHDAVPEEEI